MAKLKLKLKRDKRTELDKEIELLMEEMAVTEFYSEEYDNLLTKYERLTDIRQKEQPVKERRALDVNTVLVVVGGLMEIGLIMGYEQLHILSRNALGRVLRPKI